MFNFEQAKENAVRQKVIDHVVKLRFSWIKFSEMESYIPGFIHPVGADGVCRAQWVILNGELSNTTKSFITSTDNLDHRLKRPKHVRALKKFAKFVGKSYE